ncbi:MAG: hypothetical protein EHM45_10375 [Desulfobacteraceae bacterium]|nr:MAG: hypothetical protein EHM45_10375 [Desulfobacteraceae bacterium]
MKRIVLMLFAGAALILAGCSAVGTKNPVGTPVQEDLSAQFDGLWDFGDENVGYVKYMGNGQLRIAGLEWKDNHFKLTEMNGTLTECGNNRFINIQDEDSDSNKELDYLFGYYKFVDDIYLTIWLPKKEVFEQAIIKGLLKGKVTSDKYGTSVFLTDSSENICLFLKKHKIEELFKLEDPMIYRRIRKIEMKGNAPAATNTSGTTACAKPPCP